jgi:hypothetical protein
MSSSRSKIEDKIMVGEPIHGTTGIDRQGADGAIRKGENSKPRSETKKPSP